MSDLSAVPSYPGQEGSLRRVFSILFHSRRAHAMRHGHQHDRSCPHRCPEDRSCREEDPARHPDAIPLTELGNGMIGRFAYSLKEGGSSSFLCEIGLMPGTKVELIRVAPLWGPIQVRVRGCDIALGRSIARHIFVERSGA